MQFALVAGASSVTVELLAAFSNAKIVKLSGYGGVLLLSGFSGTLLFTAEPHMATFLIWVICIYRMINASRVFAGRIHELRMIRVTRRTSIYLQSYLGVAVAFWLAARYFEISNIDILWAVVLVSLAASLVINFTIRRNLKKSSLRGSDTYRPDSELPTVSVCIPARNETEDLPKCLTSILDSNYPKLEVLVLDDCSQDKTSEIIRGFAHKGVRFIQGEPPNKGWLAKNQAYAQLVEAASGDVLLFCGVDVRLGKKAIWSMVDSMTSRRKKMISVLPKGMQTREHAGLVQPMRYWWELAWPRKLFNRPPVLSTCWMIYRDTLKELGGFKAVNNSVVPERYLARELVKNDAYSFLRSSRSMEVSSTKKLNEQWETAVRTRYPELRKRPESVFVVSFFEFSLLIVPLAIFLTGFMFNLGLIWILSGLSVISIGFAHYRIIKAWQLADTSLPLAMLPAAASIELFLLQYSMLKYEFSSVEWKERNICIPVMRSIPRLPKIQ